MSNVLVNVYSATIIDSCNAKIARLKVRQAELREAEVLTMICERNWLQKLLGIGHTVTREDAEKKADEMEKCGNAWWIDRWQPNIDRCQVLSKMASFAISLDLDESAFCAAGLAR